MKYIPSAMEMDGMIWAQGYSRWICEPFAKNTVRPHELDYLRGLHNEPVLNALGDWLSKRTRSNVRLRSMWQDKHVYVTPVDHTGNDLPRRELADLAVFVQHFRKTGIHRSMWILQAKVSTKPTSPFTSGSSPGEIELFERTDCFTLLDGQGSPVGRSYYAHEFNGPTHWAFLTFHKNHRNATRKGGAISPTMMRWPGSVRPIAPTVTSFCDSLLQACHGRLGAPVHADPTKDEWSRLYAALMVDSMARLRTKYAISSGNPAGSVMQFAACALPNTVNRAAQLLSRRPDWKALALSLWPILHAYPDRFFLRQRPVNIYCERGRWGGDSYPGEVDMKLFEEAFPGEGGEPPEPPNDAGANSDGDGNGPGFSHILFVDISHG